MLYHDYTVGMDLVKEEDSGNIFITPFFFCLPFSPVSHSVIHGSWWKNKANILGILSWMWGPWQQMFWQMFLRLGLCGWKFSWVMLTDMSWYWFIHVICCEYDSWLTPLQSLCSLRQSVESAPGRLVGCATLFCPFSKGSEGRQKSPLFFTQSSASLQIYLFILKFTYSS